MWDEDGPHRFPAQDLKLGEETIRLAVPFGQVLLFGAKNKVFMPGAGFDIRYALEDAYKTPPALPGLPGLVTDLVATRADGVSYGVAAARPPEGKESENYTWRNLRSNPRTAPDTMLVPFFATAFTGVFVGQPPDVLPQGERFSWTTYFIVGHGDVGSVRDVQLGLSGRPTGRFVARVLEDPTLRPVAGASVVVLDAAGQTYSQYNPDDRGYATGLLPPGRYRALVVKEGRHSTMPVTFDVAAGKTTDRAALTGERLDLHVEQPARVTVRISDAKGRPMPGKVSVVGAYPWSEGNKGLEARRFLYTLALGERWLSTDLVPDRADDEATRQYLERVMIADSDGRASGEVRPGRYALVVSRGPEYEPVRVKVPVSDTEGGRLAVLRPGVVYEYEATLERVVATPGAISADLHVHSSNSIDGSISPSDRVVSYAAEGVEFLAATDHNFVSDFQPELEAHRLQDFLATTSGVELTTLEMGHFNAFPLAYQPGDIRHGSFDWVGMPPDALFQQLRAIGTTDTIVQVNHPRDTIMGYWNQFNVDPDPTSATLGQPRPGSFLASPQGPAFDRDAFRRAGFDAMEVFNGKRRELLRTFRMPAGALPKPEIPAEEGEIIRKACSAPCDRATWLKREVAFPGVVDDWFVMLNQSHPVTATGNSDSHMLYTEEAGNPRNWVLAGRDEPRDVRAGDITAALRGFRSVLSNGPYVEAVLRDGSGRTYGIGSVAKAPRKPLSLHVKVSANSLVSVDRVIVYLNGSAEAGHAWEIPASRTGVTRLDDAWQLPASNSDLWVVVVAEGDRSLWPVIVPQEQPPIAISDAVGSIAGPLGLGTDSMGDLQPSRIAPATPFAMTNPIWVDGDGDGMSFGRSEAASQSQALSAGRTVPPVPFVPEEKRARPTSNLRAMMKAWGEH